MSKRLTPLQEAKQFWTERYKEAKEAGAIKTMEAADLFLQYLEVQLPKEQQLLSEAFEAGSTSVYECVKPEGPCGFDNDQHSKNKETYLSQFKPE